MANSMTSIVIKPTIAFNHGDTFVFGSWVCTADGAGSFQHCLGGYQDRLLGGPLGLPDLRCMAPDSVEHEDYRGEVLG
jgi:hypothetical protein